MPPVYLDADSRNVSYVGKNVTARILSVPVATKNYDVHKYIVKKNPQATALQAKTSETCAINYQFSVTNCNSIVTLLDQNFVQENIVMKFFNLEDLLTKIGGITATINIALGALGVYFII